MKAISTKYIRATSTKPSRIKVSAEGVPSKFYTCDELEGTVDNIHIVAAKRFAESTGWLLKLASGGLTADSWVHCFVRESVGERGKDLVVAQARTFLENSYPTQPAKINGDKACSGYFFELLKHAVALLDSK